MLRKMKIVKSKKIKKNILLFVEINDQQRSPSVLHRMSVDGLTDYRSNDFSIDGTLPPRAFCA